MYVTDRCTHRNILLKIEVLYIGVNICFLFKYPLTDYYRNYYC